jgi:hypothetical protein
MRSRGTTPKVSAPVDIVPYLTPPPSRPDIKRPQLPSEYEPLLAELQEHFDRKGLELPVKETTGYAEVGAPEVAMRGLDEREMMYLVSPRFLECNAVAHTKVA